ncbi:PREDICTED: putative U-box domain-containing protein 50 [Ipomoea nil]|uniref:putative U-box domain-containing protein 50 n=1 Tax=Ipomoea nil TaxID=35883 RepID=UPI000900D774|nr:PREDICTED: putative U-box domain-containing protein 50 [Ipomoea nil]XP_019177365.1 PREDICTED: putative U-box domain-containing protein 50 [Ipomoea nil]
MVRDMEIPFENNKVYVAVSEDVDDGFLTLDWALRKWSTQSIVIVILYAANNICKDYVYTLLGKFPASSVSEEKLKDLEQNEEAKTHRILSKYMAFCHKVKTEILRIEKYNNEPVQKIMVDLISGIRITKLVMSLKFMRPVCWKSRGAISGSFYVHRQKPGFCELFIICGGKLVFLREENKEGLIEDEKGAILARSREKRPTFRSYVGKMFNEASAKGKKPCDLPSSSSSTSVHQWDKYKEEIELYFTQLLSSNAEASDELFQKLAKKPDMADNMTREEKRARIQEIQEVIQQIRKEAKTNPARLARAKWAMSLCSSRAVELGGCINEEIAKRAQLEKEFCSTKQELNKLQTETEEKRAMLNSTLQLRDQLSRKLHLLSQEISQAGLQVEEETRAQAAMAQEAEKLRRQRDVFLHRIEFSKGNDTAMGSGEQRFHYRQFTAAEIRAATDDLSERMRLKSGGDWTNVYKGCLNSTLVAVKIYSNSGIGDSEEAFQAKVNLLSSIRHPNILSMMGFCSELKCIVFEYMPNGCLRDILFSTHRTSKKRNRSSLNWLTRIHIAAEVSTGLSFLHEAKPRPMVHGRLNPSRILLDRNNVAKFSGLMPSMCYDASEISSDMRAFGNLILQLLSGRNWGGLVEEAIMMDQTAVINVVDEKAGDWPLELAVELGGIAVKCLSNHENEGQDVSMAMVARDMEKVKKKGDELVRSAEFAVANEGDSEVEEDAEIPSAFLCPIFQDIMQDPHIAADGFSYEVEAIGEWLRSGHDTSPMTNLKLKHSLLTPNHVLRSLIYDWQKKRLDLPSTTVQ